MQSQSTALPSRDADRRDHTVDEDRSIAPPPAASLYRHEAISGGRSRLGSPSSTMRVSTWTLVAFLVSVVVAAGVFLGTSKFARKETVSGLLEPIGGAAQVTYPKAAVVSAVHVNEGQFVHRGDPILTLELDTALETGSTLGRRLQQATQDQLGALEVQLRADRESDKAEERQLMARKAALVAQRASLTENLRLQQQHLALDDQTLAGMQQLADKGYITNVRLRQQQVQSLGDQQSISSLQGQLAQNSSDLDAVISSLSEKGADAIQTEARIAQDRAQVEEKQLESEAQSRAVLRAPYDGRVVTIRATVGQAAQAGATLAIVLPTNARLQAELWAPTKSAGFVRAGDEVRLMYDAFPFERFGSGSGRVTSVSSTPIQPSELPIAPDTKEAMYRVTVSLDQQFVAAYGRRWTLAPGGRIHADLVLERQSLLAWILDPLFATRGIESR